MYVYNNVSTFVFLLVPRDEVILLTVLDIGTVDFNFRMTLPISGLSANTTAQTRVANLKANDTTHSGPQVQRFAHQTLISIPLEVSVFLCSYTCKHNRNTYVFGLDLDNKKMNQESKSSKTLFFLVCPQSVQGRKPDSRSIGYLPWLLISVNISHFSLEVLL